MIIDDYPFSHGDQESYQGMKGNSRVFVRIHGEPFTYS